MKGGKACVNLSLAQCRSVKNVQFTDVNGFKRACDVGTEIFTGKQFCRYDAKFL